MPWPQPSRTWQMAAWGLLCLCGTFGCSDAQFRVAAVASSDAGNDAVSADDASPSDSNADAAQSFAPAPHPALPTVVGLGGPVLATPKVLPIGYASDPLKADVQTFLGQLGPSAYWTSIAAEYGVGAPVVQDWLDLGAEPPAKVSETALIQQLAVALDAPGSGLGPADPGTVYLFVIPDGTNLRRPGASADSGCCVDFDGYHSETGIGGVTVPYAVVCECPAETSPDRDLASQVMSSIAHELIEAATDPFPDGEASAFITNAAADAAWTAVTGGEVADMCENNEDVLIRPPGIDYLVPRSWSNAAALLGEDPCVPAPTDGPYFNSMPILGDTVAVTDVYGAKWQAKGVQIPVGESRSIDVALYSMGPTSEPWQVEAIDVSSFNGGTKRLSFAWDKNTGSNGDTLHLSITVLSKAKQVSGTLFMIQSRLGPRTAMSMGAVGN